MIFSTPSGCPSAETANERMTTMLNAARIAAADTTPTLTTRLKHPERNMFLSLRVGEVSNPRRSAFQHFSLSAFLLKADGSVNGRFETFVYGAISARLSAVSSIASYYTP
jgi:hypothetical protein